MSWERIGEAKSLDEAREAFIDMVGHVALRPVMYSGLPSIESLLNYLFTYEDGLHAAGFTFDLLTGFGDWVHWRFGIYHAAWSIGRILWHVAGSEADALRALQSQLRQFWKDLDEFGLDRLRREAEAIFEAAPGHTSTVILSVWYSQMKEEGRLPQ
ncbi:MAG: hypothetical protein QM770_21440 [Tepidisphaeraceae bacterium]